MTCDFLSTYKSSNVGLFQDNLVSYGWEASAVSQIFANTLKFMCQNIPSIVEVLENGSLRAYFSEKLFKIHALNRHVPAEGTGCIAPK